MDQYQELNTMRIAFWHPFGPHGGQTWKGILERKQADIAKTGKAFWAFRSAGDTTVSHWRRVLSKDDHGAIALCVFSAGNTDFVKEDGPKPVTARYWRPEKDDGDWREIDDRIRPTFAPGRGSRNVASAFLVTTVDVLEPHAYLRRKGKLLVVDTKTDKSRWESHAVRGRNQKLVQFADGSSGDSEWNGEVAAILRLKNPWVVWISDSRD